MGQTWSKEIPPAQAQDRGLAMRLPPPFAQHLSKLLRQLLDDL